MNSGAKRGLRVLVLTAGLCALLARDVPLSAAQDGGGIARIGDAVPVMEMRDIDGNKRSNKDFEEYIIVYTFADRNSNKHLQEVIRPAAKRVVEAYPDLKIAYMNFADVVAVPHFLRHVVNPILRYINDSNTKEMREYYESDGLPWNEEITPFILVPEWKGEHLKVFGVKDARDWVAFVTDRYTIHAVLDASTEDFAGVFFETFKELAAARE